MEGLLIVLTRARLCTLLAAATVLALAMVAPAQASSPAAHPFTAAQLGATQNTLDARLAHPPAGIASWGVEPATGRVVVSVVASDPGALATARAAIADLPAATIALVKERPRLFYNLVGGQAIYASGGRCSIGFSAKKGTSTYVLTAGHCTRDSGTWTGYNHVTIGPVASSAYPSDDFGTILVSSSSTWSATGTVASGSSTTPVRGSTEAAVGASVCRSGSTTGYHCGTIQAKNQTVNYGSGVVSGLTRTSACAEPGDSGGSFISGTQAQGMTSGGSGNCSSGGTTYFQPVREALDKLGLTLVLG